MPRWSARGAIEPVTIGSLIRAKALSTWDMLQPLEPVPIRISVVAMPAGLNTDMPTRSHGLYKACLNRRDSTLWAAG